MTNVNIGAMPAPAGNNRSIKEGVTRRILVPTLRWGGNSCGCGSRFINSAVTRHVGIGEWTLISECI